MSIVFRIILGLGIVGLGAFMVIRTRVIIDLFGMVDWAEAKLGGGGTNLFYKLLGILFCIIGFIVATDMWNAFLQATIGSLLPKG